MVHEINVVRRDGVWPPAMDYVALSWGKRGVSGYYHPPAALLVLNCDRMPLSGVNLGILSWITLRALPEIWHLRNFLTPQGILRKSRIPRFVCRQCYSILSDSHPLNPKMELARPMSFQPSIYATRCPPCAGLCETKLGPRRFLSAVEMADNSSGVKSVLPKVDATVDVELDEDISPISMISIN